MFRRALRRRRDRQQRPASTQTNPPPAPPPTAACRNSLKKINPHKIPSRLFEFHSGNAMLNPTSRIAKIVIVFATAHKHPASTAHTSKCGARRTSARTEDVPRINAGTLHRARNTPKTIISEMTIGEIPTVTSLVGASAAPNHAPAVKPHKIPSSCNFRAREVSPAAAQSN